MRNKIVWSVTSLAMVAALLLISCGPRAATPAPTTPTPTQAPGAAMPTPAPTAAVQAPVPVASTEKPRYGGTINILVPNFLDKFDGAVSPG